MKTSEKRRQQLKEAARRWREKNKLKINSNVISKRIDLHALRIEELSVRIRILEDCVSKFVDIKPSKAVY